MNCLLGPSRLLARLSVYVRSSSSPVQRCSPIIEMSTWRPHVEHFIVEKLDILGMFAMIPGDAFTKSLFSSLFPYFIWWYVA